MQQLIYNEKTGDFIDAGPILQKRKKQKTTKVVLLSIGGCILLLSTLGYCIHEYNGNLTRILTDKDSGLIIGAYTFNDGGSNILTAAITSIREGSFKIEIPQKEGTRLYEMKVSADGNVNCNGLGNGNIIYEPDIGIVTITLTGYGKKYIFVK